MRFRIKAFDDETDRKLDNIRESTSKLLPRFSYSLGHGAHWMPDTAWPLRELRESESEGQGLLKHLVADDAAGYVKGRLPQIRAEANELYQEFRPGERLSERELVKITTALTERIEHALEGGLVSRVTRSSIGFQAASNSNWISQWGQAYTLLVGIATHARKALTTEFYFFRGLGVDRDELLSAMDVCAAHLLRPDVRWTSRPDALKELDQLKLIQQMKARSGETEDALQKRRCEAILKLMDG